MCRPEGMRLKCQAGSHDDTSFAGISFHNLKFKDERILYELSLQDQFVAYSGVHQCA